MIILPNHDKRRNRQPVRNSRLAAAFLAAFTALAMAGAAHAQVTPTASAGSGFGLSVGATGTGEYLQYGERKMVGITAFADYDLAHHLGIEGEAHFVQYLQTANVYFSTYSGGVRYRYNFGRLQPYAKGLFGEGYFNFPYNLATGHYMVITAGGGLDFRLNRNIHIRAADAEWQYWPGFSFGTKTTPLTTAGVSAGIRVRIP
jgi:Outer membrane protein beta-barrel domain